jgi:hypothetical protein
MAKLNMFILLLMLTTITLMTTGCKKEHKEHRLIVDLLGSRG